MSDARPCSDSHSLSCLQGDDDEDGPPVHPSHAAAVAHEVVQDGGELGPHLPGRGKQALSDGDAGRGPPVWGWHLTAGSQREEGTVQGLQGS